MLTRPEAQLAVATTNDFDFDLKHYQGPMPRTTSLPPSLLQSSRMEQYINLVPERQVNIDYTVVTQFVVVSCDRSKDPQFKTSFHTIWRYALPDSLCSSS